jgi:hypothetical protein
MKIKKGDLKIDTNSLVNIEWRNKTPRLIVHEKYENIIKWVLRIFTFIGIVTSIISLEWYQSLLLTLILIIIEQFFERAIFEYTTILFQPFPGFEIDGKRWKTVGYAMMEIKDDEFPPYVGPAFDDEDYARNFFEYIQSWNKIEKDDPENLIIVSFILERDSTYSLFIYANPNRKNLDKRFKDIEEKRKFEKFGKRHQQLFSVFVFAHNFKYAEGLLVDKFLQTYDSKSKFYFAPFVINKEDNKLKILNSLAIKKYEYKINRREMLTEKDHEYHTKFNTEK